MRDRFFMLSQETVPNSWTMERCCKVGGLSKVITDEVLWKELVGMMAFTEEFRSLVQMFLLVFVCNYFQYII